MLDMFNNACIAVYTNVTGFFHELKNDERGLSGVVVTVMLILVAVLAVTLVWKLLGNQINAWWRDIIQGSTKGIDDIPPYNGG